MNFLKLGLRRSTNASTDLRRIQRTCQRGISGIVRKWEFVAKYNLTGSDAENMTLGGLLALVGVGGALLACWRAGRKERRKMGFMNQRLPGI